MFVRGLVIAATVWHVVAAGGCNGYMGLVSSTSAVDIIGDLPDGQLDAPVECRWVFVSPTSDSVQFTLTNFVLQASIADKVVVYAGNNSTSTFYTSFIYSTAAPGTTFATNVPAVTIVAYVQPGRRMMGRTFTFSIGAPSPPPYAPCPNGSTTLLSGAANIGSFLPSNGVSFPAGYYAPRNWVCRWLVSVPGQRVYFSMTSSGRKLAPGDSIIVTDITALQNYTYDYSLRGPKFVDYVTASESTLLVEYRSGPAMDNQDFTLYSGFVGVIAVPGAPEPVLCRGVMPPVMGDTGNFSNMNPYTTYMQYKVNTTCSWLVTVSPGNNIQFDGQLNSELYFDQLTIYDGSDATAPIVGGSQSGCQFVLPTAVTSGNVAYVTWITNGDYQSDFTALNYNGFQLTYTANPIGNVPPTPPDSPSLNGCSGVKTVSAPTTISVGLFGNLTNGYPRNANCGWIIRAPTGVGITVSMGAGMKSLNSADKVRAYISNTPDSRYFIGEVGPSFTARIANNVGYLEFVSDGIRIGLEGWGFIATISVVPNLNSGCTATGNTVPIPNVAFGYPFSFANSNFYMRPGQDCQWLIDVGVPIVFTFVRAPSPTSRFILYDGNSTSAPVRYADAYSSLVSVSVAFSGPAVIRYTVDNTPLGVSTSTYGWWGTYATAAAHTALPVNALNWPATAPIFFPPPGTTPRTAQDFRYNVWLPLGYAIANFQFTGFVLEQGGTVDVYDGADTSAPLIFHLVGVDAINSLSTDRNFVLGGFYAPSCDQLTVRVRTVTPTPGSFNLTMNGFPTPPGQNITCLQPAVPASPVVCNMPGTYNATTVAQLMSCTTFSSDIVLNNLGPVTVFPNLVSAMGGIFIGGTQGAPNPNISFPALVSVAGAIISSSVNIQYVQTISLSSGLHTLFALPALKAADTLSMFYAVPVFPGLQWAGCIKLFNPLASAMSLPALQFIRVWSLAGNVLASISLPNLLLAGTFSWPYDTSLGETPFISLSVPSLVAIFDTFYITRHPLLTSLSFPALQSVGFFNMTVNNMVNTISMPSLVNYGTFQVFDMPAVTMINLPAKTGGTLLLARNSALTNITAPALLSSDVFRVNNNVLLASLSVPSLLVSRIFIDDGNNGLVQVTFPSLKRADFSLVSGNYRLLYASLPALIFAGSFQITSLELVSFYVPLVSQITSLSTTSTRLASVNFPSLSSAGSITLGTNLELTQIGLGKLKTVSSDLKISDSSAVDLSLAMLETVGGTFSLTNNRLLSSLQICHLTSVATSLIITSSYELSCVEARKVFAGLPLSMANTDCNPNVIGTFGCQSNFTRTVNISSCGFSLSCIQTAISASYSDADIVVAVPPGTYTGCDVPLNFLGRQLVLQGAGIGVTVLDCQGAGSAFLFSQGEGPETLVTGLSVVNGNAATDGGAFSIFGASPTFDTVSFQNNRAMSGHGGAGFIAGGAPTLRNCRFSGNQAYQGGAIASTNVASLTIEGCNITSNTAFDAGGGVAYLSTALSTISDSHVSFNSAVRGAGVYADQAVRLADTSLVGNVASDYGGAIAGVPAASTGISITGSGLTVADNTATHRGAGIFLYSCGLVLSDSVLTGNFAGETGAGISASCSQAYIALLNVEGACPITVSVTDTSFTDNMTPGNGGAMMATQIVVNLNGVTMSHNSGLSGGGAYVSASNLTATDVQITSNTASLNGGGIFCGADGTCVVTGTGSSVTGNRAAAAGGGVFFCQTGCQPKQHAASSLQVTASQIAGNTAGGYGAEMATDPFGLAFQYPLDATVVSGNALGMENALNVIIHDAYSQVVSSGLNVLQLSIDVNNAVLAGPTTVLASLGVAIFANTRLLALNATRDPTGLNLTVRHSTLPAVALISHVTIMPCGVGQGGTIDNSGLSCIDCFPGTISQADSNLPCLPCPAGQISINALSTVCMPCPVGTFQPSAGASTCITCPQQSSSAAGATQCDAAIVVPISPAVYGGIGAGIFVLIIAGLILVGCCVYRRTKRKTMEKYYLDEDATVRHSSSDSALALAVRKMIGATSTTRIGGGEYSDVYKAKYNDEWIALKVMRGESVGNATAQSEFQREVSALSIVSNTKHPAIVELRFFLERSPTCIGLEFCPAGSLKRSLKDLNLSDFDKIRMAAHIASALATLHDKGIVHQDVKTDNILLVENNAVKLADFGICRIFTNGVSMSRRSSIAISSGAPMPSPSLFNTQGPSPMMERSNSQEMGTLNTQFGPSIHNPIFAMTGHGSGLMGSVDLSSMNMPGGMDSSRSGASIESFPSLENRAFTPQYVDPFLLLHEDSQNNSELILQRADIFAFAITMWAIYAQDEPFAGIPATALVRQRMANPAMRPPALVECHPCYAQLMVRAWDADPAQRPTMRECYASLQTCLREHFGAQLPDEFTPGHKAPQDLAAAVTAATNDAFAPSTDKVV